MVKEDSVGDFFGNILYVARLFTCKPNPQCPEAVVGRIDLSVLGIWFGGPSGSQCPNGVGKSRKRKRGREKPLLGGVWGL
ncbi:hypothetical protein XELAEV_18009600mg [Xenopus laevis]|uniref:Uncharacterized protein n=1 Tax=Xenopus laevis TaxID=8355 RepID=A0A974DSN3_XENLA|nr:hypothetical protein XELAEV_18009600mg [Xenopus laevis]